MLRIYFFIAILFVSSNVFAQATSPTEVQSAIALTAEPAFALSNAIKLNLELRAQQPLLAFEISPELYVGTPVIQYSGDEQTRSNDNVKGFGLMLHHKLYLNNNIISPYLAYGVAYRDIAIGYNDEGFVPAQYGNLTYYSYKIFNDEIRIKSTLLDLRLGMKVVAVHGFIIEVYAGGGYKFSKSMSNYEGFRNYSKYVLDFGYKGVVPQLGFKLGYNFQ